VRTERSRPLVVALETWLREQGARVSKNSDTGKAINSSLKRWAALTRFLDDGRLCMTNNAAERELRAIAVGRRDWTFAGSDEGGWRPAALYTLITTAKLNGVDPQAWLADVLARMPDYPAKRISDLLPWNWHAERRAAASCRLKNQAGGTHWAPRHALFDRGQLTWLLATRYFRKIGRNSNWIRAQLSLPFSTLIVLAAYVARTWSAGRSRWSPCSANNLTVSGPRFLTTKLQGVSLCEIKATPLGAICWVQNRPLGRSSPPPRPSSLGLGLGLGLGSGLGSSLVFLGSIILLLLLRGQPNFSGWRR